MRAFIGIPLLGPRDLPALLNRLKLNDMLRVEKAGNLHVTVLFFAELPEGKVERVGRAIEGIGIGRFRIRYGRISGFPDPGRSRVIILEIHSPELLDISHAILSGLNIIPDRKFVPHLTLARAKHPIAIKDLGIDAGMFDGMEEEAEKIVLFQSILGRTGAVHRPIREHQLM